MARSFKQFLVEAPLPDDWDSSVYNRNSGKNSFAKMVQYAKEKAKRIGTGSSRVAFKIEYQGRPTVLKIAKNKRGMAQNEFEAEIMSDHYIQGLGITIPLIDYDEASSTPTWIHTEFALKVKEADFIKVSGAPLSDVLRYVESYHQKRSTVDVESEWLHAFDTLVRSYDLPIGDFSTLTNWGMYKNSPVVVDVGLSQNVLDLHYSPKARLNS